MHIGERIALLRKPKMTQIEFASVTGVSPKTVSRWESGVRKPDSDTLQLIAKALGTSAAFLLGETNDPTPTSSKPQKKQLHEGAAESITLPSGRVVTATPDQTAEYLEWQQNRTTQTTIALAATLGIPLSDLVPSENTSEYPTAKHKELAAILEIMAQNDPKNGILPRGVSKLQDIPENDVKYILEAIKQTARWKVGQVMEEERE